MSVNQHKVTAFVESLRTAPMPSGGLVNIYDDSHDPHGWRRTRLRRWLTLQRDGGPLVLFVGEAPGRDGAAVTGVPFASIETLTEPGFERLHACPSDRKFVAIGDVPTPQREATARSFWRTVLPLTEGMPLPVVWNIVPFWPHRFGANRKPRVPELRFGLSWTERILKTWEFDAVVSVGRCAEQGLNIAGVASEYVRHPSRGGANPFAAGIRRVLNGL